MLLSRCLTWCAEATQRSSEGLPQALQAHEWLFYIISSSVGDFLWLSSDSGQIRMEGFVHHVSHSASEILIPFQLDGCILQWMRCDLAECLLAPSHPLHFSILCINQVKPGTWTRLCAPTTLNSSFWVLNKNLSEVKAGPAQAILL